jgi:hypothetical protein
MPRTADKGTIIRYSDYNSSTSPFVPVVGLAADGRLKAEKSKEKGLPPTPPEPKKEAIISLSTVLRVKAEEIDRLKTL